MPNEAKADDASMHGDEEEADNLDEEKHQLEESRDRDIQNIIRRRRNSSLYQYSTEITYSEVDKSNPKATKNSQAPESIDKTTSDHTAPDESGDKAGVSIVEEKLSSKDHPRVTRELLTENIFSLIYTAPVSSAAFWMGIFVALFQIAMPSLALLDLIIFGDTQNPLQVPNSVSLQVRIIGVMALILAVSQFWDFMEAIFKLERGPSELSPYTPRGASCWKFYLAYTLQFIMGTLFHITIFVLVVQSTTVIGMFLNFAALEFITTIDDVAFALGRRGYFLNSIKIFCDEVSEVAIIRKKGGRIPRRIQMLVVTAALLGMYTYIIFQELGGKFYCNRIEVQFGDGFLTILPVFSGVYYYERDFHDGRPVYRDERKRAAFRYCAPGRDEGIFSFASSGYWVFNVLSSDTKSIKDMCTNYMSRSPDTKGYDILEMAPSSWITKHRVTDTIEYTVDHMSLKCVDCNPSNCNGQCIEGECACSDNQFGLHCQFEKSSLCEETDYDRRTRPFSGAGIVYSSTYELLRNSNDDVALSYHRPIYSHVNAQDEIDILMNFGRRYFLFYLNATLIDGVNDVSEDTHLLADYLENDVHPYYDWIEPMFVSRTNESSPFQLPVFVSDPIDIGTATDNSSPLSLSWWRVNRIELDIENYFDMFLIGGQMDTVLLCAACSKVSPCSNNGVCNKNRSCRCTFGHVGRLCEADCWEDRGIDLCPRCFEEYKLDDTCGDCYRDSRKALDCPNCRMDPFASDCIDCSVNSTAAGCKEEVRDTPLLGPGR